MKSTRHIARKRFGQHFLADQAIIEAILNAIDPVPGQVMVEIGPGLGAMTLPLVSRLGHLTVIELDRDLAERLRSNPLLNVIEGDVLNMNFTELAGTLAANSCARVAVEKLRVVGNLPYNISSPILFHLLEHVTSIEDQHFMLQKEVIDRMVASPCTKSYGRLSVMLQWRYHMESLFLVPPESFNPPPRVNSAVVRMRPLAEVPALDVQRLEEIVRVAFSQRRKLLRHTLGHWLESTHFSGSFDLQRRAEEVPVHEYLALAQCA